MNSAPFTQSELCPLLKANSMAPLPIPPAAQLIISLLARQPGLVPAIMYVAASARIRFQPGDNWFGANWTALYNAALTHLPVARRYRVPYISVPDVFTSLGGPNEHYGVLLGASLPSLPPLRRTACCICARPEALFLLASLQRCAGTSTVRATRILLAQRPAPSA